MKLTEEEKEYIKEKSLDGIACKYIAKDLGRHYDTVKRFLNKHGLPSNPEKQGIPLKYYEEIFKLYNSGLTLEQIHQNHFPQFTVNQINYICREKGITRKQGAQVKNNGNYFSNIDTEEKAYFLGLITADGYLYKRPNMESYVVSLSLAKEDKYIVEKFKDAVKTDRKVKEYINNTGFQRKDEKPHIECRVVIYSKQMFFDLFNYGVTPQKSEKLSKIPSIDQNLMRHYIRGFFDGNGCVCVSHSSKNKNRKNIKIYFYSTHLYCENLKTILEKDVDVNKIKVFDHKNEKCSFLTYGSKKDVRSLFEYLYKDATIYMERKYNKFRDFLSENTEIIK